MVQPAQAWLVGKAQIEGLRYMPGFCGCLQWFLLREEDHKVKLVTFLIPSNCMTNIQTCDFSFLIAIKSGQWFVLIKILRLSVRFLTYLFDSFFQLPDRFKFAPEMEAYVDAFLNSCDDPERQLAVMIGFSTLTNQGYPVVPSIWRVVRHLQPVALQKYIDWLKDMFLRPDLSCCLDFSTSRQKQNPENVNKWVCWWCTFFFFFLFVVGVATCVKSGSDSQSLLAPLPWADNCFLFRFLCPRRFRPSIWLFCWDKIKLCRSKHSENQLEICSLIKTDWMAKEAFSLAFLALATVLGTGKSLQWLPFSLQTLRSL